VKFFDFFREASATRAKAVRTVQDTGTLLPSLTRAILLECKSTGKFPPRFDSHRVIARLAGKLQRSCNARVRNGESAEAPFHLAGRTHDASLGRTGHIERSRVPLARCAREYRCRGETA